MLTQRARNLTEQVPPGRLSFLLRRNCTTLIMHRKTGSLVQDVRQSGRSKAKSGVAFMLTFSAGMVDIVGYIAVYHWFVAHMTGDTVHLGNQLATANWGEAEKAGTVIGSFILGSIVGRAVIEAGARKRQRTIASITLLAEAALIFAFICTRSFVVGSNGIPLPTLLVLLALLAAAMGLQTATLTKIGPLTICDFRDRHAEQVRGSNLGMVLLALRSETKRKAVARIKPASRVPQCPVHGLDLVELYVWLDCGNVDVLALERLGPLSACNHPDHFRGD